MPDTFGNRLREARVSKGLLQREVADKAGIHKNMVGMYERGEADHTVFAATCLADVLGVSLDWLAGRKEV